MFQPVSNPLQDGLRFFPQSSTHKALSVPLGSPAVSRQPFGLTLFRLNLRAGQTLPVRRRQIVHVGLVLKDQSSPRTFWFKPLSMFGLSKFTTFNGSSHMLVVSARP